MRKSTKNLLGLSGLALVGAMTVAALSIPVPDASATGGASVGGEVQVVVKVHSGNPEVNILTPADGIVTTNPNMTINTYYDDIENLGFELKWDKGKTNANANNGDGSAQPLGVSAAQIDLGTYIPSSGQIGGSGEYAFTIDLRAYGGYARYVIRADLESSSEQELTDNSGFRYAPVVVTYIGTDENGDPMFEIEYDEFVTTVDLDLIGADGKSAVETPVKFTNPTPGKGGKTTMTIPAGSYGLESGTYTAAATAYGPQAEAEVDNDSAVYDDAAQTISADFSYDDNTAKVYFQLVDANGKLLIFPDATYTVANPGTAGSDTVVIDLSEIDLTGYDLSSFTIYTSAYAIIGSTKNIAELDSDNGPVTLNIKYEKPAAPDVPNTGLFGGVINFARMDYLVTGAVGISLVTIIALVMLKKQNRHSSRRRR